MQQSKSNKTAQVLTNSNATQIMSNKPLNFVTNSNATKNKGFVNFDE
jgi:hypothetical protein